MTMTYEQAVKVWVARRVNIDVGRVGRVFFDGREEISDDRSYIEQNAYLGGEMFGSSCFGIKLRDVDPAEFVAEIDAIARGTEG